MLLLNKHNLSIANLTSKEESRCQLHAIQVTATSTRETDGHQALIVALPELSQEAKNEFPVIAGVTPDESGNSFLIERETALEVAKNIPRSSLVPILEYVLVGEAKEDGSRPLATTDGKKTRIIQDPQPLGQFPAIEMIDPKKDPIASFSLDAQILCALLTQIKSMGKNGKSDVVGVKFYIYSNEDVIKLTAKTDAGQDVTAYIMPMNE